MSAVLWCVLAGGTYFVGFIIAGVIEQRLCHLGDHRYCNHPFEGPEPAMWPLVAVIALAAAPFIGAGVVSRWLAGRETATERRDRLDVERDARVREQAATIARLEREAGLR